MKFHRKKENVLAWCGLVGTCKIFKSTIEFFIQKQSIDIYVNGNITDSIYVDDIDSISAKAKAEEIMEQELGKFMEEHTCEWKLDHNAVNDVTYKTTCIPNPYGMEETQLDWISNCKNCGGRIILKEGE